MENFIAVVAVTVSPCCPSWRGVMTVHNKQGSWNSPGAFDLQASLQNGGEGWSHQWHLLATQRQRQPMLFKSHGEMMPARSVSLLQGLLISEKHPKPSCKFARNSFYCWWCWHCVLGAAHTLSHYSPQPPQALTTIMPIVQVRKERCRGQRAYPRSHRESE